MEGERLPVPVREQLAVHRDGLPRLEGRGGQEAAPSPWEKAASRPGCTPVADPLTVICSSWLLGTPSRLIWVCRVASRESGSGETRSCVPDSTSVRFSVLGTHRGAAGPRKAASSAMIRLPPSVSAPALVAITTTPPSTNPRRSRR